MIMKLYKRISLGLSFLALGVFGTSCADFLDEKLTTQQNTDYFDTPEGIDGLEVSLYYNLRFHFAKEYACATTNSGTDEFRVGGDGSNASWNNYDGNLQSQVVSNSTKMEEVWDGMYNGINNANLLLSKVTPDSYRGSNKNLYMGEAHFLRGLNYFKLVSQYGGVPLKLTPSTSPEREFARATTEATYLQVIDDLKKAYELLPTSASAIGKMTKDAAAHFLAKAYLCRASEINDSWNGATKAADLAESLRLAQEVISHRQLATNYADLWNYTEPNGANEQLDEILLAAQFSSDKSTEGASGNQCHLYYVSVYRDLPYMQRDIAGEREYQRLRTTYYVYNNYDMVNDSRFWKSFKTKYAVNNPGQDGKYTHGDLGIMYVINRPGDTRYSGVQLRDEVVYEKTGKTIPSVFVAYPNNQNGKDDVALYDYTNRYCTLNKFIDGSRDSRDSRVGYRDGILARLGETYLIAAEALIRQQKYDESLTYINRLRQRAAYKNGEDRSAYCDGGAAYKEGSLGFADNGVNSYYAENSYYESNNISRTTAATELDIDDIRNLPAEDEAVIEKLGYSSDYDRMMCLLLNERSRELCGEFYRWEDLSRTKTLVARAKAYNPDAASNINERHFLRPIPQTYLDAIQKDGHSLTAEEKKAQQNPGY